MNADISTLRDFLMRYNVVTEACFESCVNDFSARSVIGDEDKCSANCFTKLLNATQRLSLRFQTQMLENHSKAGKIDE